MRIRSERGATAVTMVLLMTSLIAAIGLSADIGNAVYQRSRLQNSADAAALAIGHDCVLGKPACSQSGAEATATYFANQNAGGGTASVPGGVSAGTGTAEVRVSKIVPMMFSRLVGASDKNVMAKAKATWGGNPTMGSPVLPLGISWCTYNDNKPPSTNRVLLRTDLVSRVFHLLTSGGPLGRLVGNLPGTLTGVSDSCDGPDGDDDDDEGGGEVVMLSGAIWLSDIEGTVNGLFNWDSSSCNLKLDDINAFVGSTTSAVIPSNCMNRLGTQVKKGQTMLLPVYHPAGHLLSSLGFETEASALDTRVKIPPRLGIEIVGFAPFKVTGWSYPGYENLDPSMPPCDALTLSIAPPISLGCNGIQGYFVKSATRDPNFEYGPDGADLGANSARLSD